MREDSPHKESEKNDTNYYKGGLEGSPKEEDKSTFEDKISFDVGIILIKK